MHGSAATPVYLINKLIEQKERLKNVELVSITQKGIDLNSPDLEGHFFVNSLFVSESNRKAVNSKTGDYVPVFLSEIPFYLPEIFYRLMWRLYKFLHPISTVIVH